MFNIFLSIIISPIKLLCQPYFIVAESFYQFHELLFLCHIDNGDILQALYCAGVHIVNDSVHQLFPRTLMFEPVR